MLAVRIAPLPFVIGSQTRLSQSPVATSKRNGDNWGVISQFSLATADARMHYDLVTTNSHTLRKISQVCKIPQLTVEHSQLAWVLRLLPRDAAHACALAQVVREFIDVSSQQQSYSLQQSIMLSLSATFYPKPGTPCTCVR